MGAMPPAASKKTQPQPALHDLHKADVIAFDRNERPIVRLLGSGVTIRCDVLDSGLGPIEVRLGDSVLTAIYPHDPSTGCILGRVAASAAASGMAREPVRRKQLHLDVETLRITAKTELTLGTPQARIRMDKEGRLELLAHTLVSKARRLQKLLAPMLRLN
jgi:hypothetical protein